MGVGGLVDSEWVERVDCFGGSDVDENREGPPPSPRPAPRDVKVEFGMARSMEVGVKLRDWGGLYGMVYLLREDNLI